MFGATANLLISSNDDPYSAGLVGGGVGMGIGVVIGTFYSISTTMLARFIHERAARNEQPSQIVTPAFSPPPPPYELVVMSELATRLEEAEAQPLVQNDNEEEEIIKYVPSPDYFDVMEGGDEAFTSLMPSTSRLGRFSPPPTYLEELVAEEPTIRYIDDSDED